MEALLGNFITEIGRKITHTLTMGRETLHSENNDNSMMIVNFTFSKKNYSNF